MSETSDNFFTKTLVVLTGPTAVGKTELSLNLAKLLSSSIISADSRQIYKHLTIGAATPTKEQQALVEHHFVEKLELDQYYSAAMYEQEVLKLLDRLFQNQDFALMTGGSMMYIDAVCNGIDDIPTVDEKVREMMKEKLKTEGSDALLQQLRLFDPNYYNIVDRKNTKRVVHALEICYMTGKPYSSFRTGKKKERNFNIVKVGLERDRAVLFDRINRRVDQMIEMGLLEEARSLFHLRHLNSLNTVGYKEMFKVIEGEWDLPFAVERMKKNTRVYAKKQMTWMKKDEDINWICLDNANESDALKKIMLLLGSN